MSKTPSLTSPAPILNYSFVQNKDRKPHRAIRHAPFARADKQPPRTIVSLTFELSSTPPPSEPTPICHASPQLADPDRPHSSPQSRGRNPRRSAGRISIPDVDYRLLYLRCPELCRHENESDRGGRDTSAGFDPILSSSLRGLPSRPPIRSRTRNGAAERHLAHALRASPSNVAFVTRTAF